MGMPTVDGLTVTFPAGSKYVTEGGFGGSVIPIVSTDIELDACTAGTEVVRIFYKQGVAASAFVNCPALGFTQRTAISVNSVALVGGGSGANIQTHTRGIVYTTDAVVDPLQQADVDLDYKQERYDLLEVDSSGVVHVIKGQEVGFAAAEFLPTPTPGRYPIFHAYVWNDTVELIQITWDGLVPRSPFIQSQVAALRAYNTSKLANLRAALQGGAATLAGYGDSITAVGGGWAATGGDDDTTWLDDMANNEAGYVTRDSSGFVNFHDAALRTKYTELGASFPQNTPELVEWGQLRRYGIALASQFGATVTTKNWGIGGTSEGTGTVSGAPNGGDETRLATLNADTFHAVIVDFMMNGAVGFATSDYTTPVTNIVTAIKAAKPNADIILRCTHGINTENPNTLSWFDRANEIYRRVAVVNDCAFIPGYIFSHGDPGFLQISRQHYSGANRYNHQLPYEFEKRAALDMHVLGF